MNNQNTTSTGKGDQDIDLTVLLTFLWIHKWILIATMGAGLILGGYYALRVAEPQFLSVSRIAFEDNAPRLIDLESMLPGASTESQAINTELEVVRSYPLIAQLVQQEGLLEDPEFNPTLMPPSMPSALIGGLKSLLGGGEEEAFSDQQILNATVKRVSASVRATPQRDTFLFNIGVVTTSPEKSTRLANALAQIYLDNQVTVKFEATEYAVNWLSQRVAELEQELKTSEQAAKKLRETSDLVSQEALDMLSTRASGLRNRLSQTTEDIERGEMNVSLMETMLAAGDFAGIAEIADDVAFTRFLEGGAQGAAVRTRAEALIERIRAGISTAESRRQLLQSSLDDLQGQIDEQTAALIQLNTLVRDVEANRALYETFLTRLKEISIQLGLQRPDSRILSEATSSTMIAPRTAMIAAFGMVFGAVIGLGIVMLRFLRQSGLQSIAATERATGLPVLGQLPQVAIRQREELLPYFVQNPTSAMAEAVRNLRTSILMLRMNPPPAVILLSSTVPGESKTTTAITLAKNVSDLGRRVLLMEADNRRLALAQYFNVDERSNLFTAMRDERPIASVAAPTDYGFDVLVGAKSTINAADIFSSSAFEGVLRRAREEYDMIIIDAPPVLAVPDARIIAPLADVVLYCVAWNATPEAQVQAGLREFSGIGDAMFGAVLTKVDRKAAAQYGYGSYGYGAGAYYGT